VPKSFRHGKKGKEETGTTYEEEKGKKCLQIRKRKEKEMRGRREEQKEREVDRG